MPDRNYEAPDNANDPPTDVVATPEGDNEFTPDEPLTKLPDEALQEPRGSNPESRDL